jgi:thiosulfate reductase cytochrome b subunit
MQPVPIRLTHWINAAAVIGMMMSGWAIYNASPLFGFSFPRWATLGGWLGGAIAWHLALMWLLVGNFLIYAAYLLWSGAHRRLRPPGLSAVLADLRAAVRFRLAHQPGEYNAIQRLTYCVVLLAVALVVLSGLALWKPVQLQTLASLLGGYEWARRVHFGAMTVIAGFTLLHVSMALLVPSVLWAMIGGRART